MDDEESGCLAVGSPVARDQFLSPRATLSSSLTITESCAPVTHKQTARFPFSYKAMSPPGADVDISTVGGPVSANLEFLSILFLTLQPVREIYPSLLQLT